MKRLSASDKTLIILAYLFMGVLCLTILYPFWNLIVISFNSSADTARGGLTFFPRVFTLENYEKVFVDKRLIRAFGVTVSRTVITTVVSTLFTAIFAYGLSRKKLRFRRSYAKFCHGDHVPVRRTHTHVSPDPETPFDQLVLGLCDTESLFGVEHDYLPVLL